MSTIRIIVMVIGVICGISGLEHGFFEILQGNKQIELHLINGNNFIYAIGETNRFWKYGYEYAFTIIPNYLTTGIVTMIISLGVIICSIEFIHKKFGWLIFIILSIMQYLTGGGAAQSGLVIFLGIFAIFINKPVKFWSNLIPLKIRQILAKSWLFILIIFSIIFVHSMITASFGFLWGINDPEIIIKVQWYFLYAMTGVFPILLIVSLSFDSLKVIDSK